MTNRKKTFDCVEMKNRIQRDLIQEYDARKAQFSSYVDFLNATANESEEIRTFLEKIASAKTAAQS
jgi:predicted nucleic-acid-binding protein